MLVAGLGMVGKFRHINKGGQRKRVAPGPDYGTLEIQRKRVLALGGEPMDVNGADYAGRPITLRIVNKAAPDADTSLAVSPLGVYFARGLLDPDREKAKALYEAGMYFRYCYGVTFGRAGARSGLGSIASFDPEETKLELVEGIYREIATLLRRDFDVFNIVWNVCVFDRYLGGRWHIVKLVEGLGWISRNRAKVAARVKAKIGDRREIPLP